MKKRVVAVVCCAVLAMSAFAGCGSKSTNKYASSDYKGEVKLADYEGIEVAASVAAVDEDDVQAQVDDCLANYASDLKYSEGTTVKDGDQVNFDCRGYIEEGEVEDAAGTAISLTIGEGTYDDIEGFEDGLIGVEVGDTVTIEAKFSDDYGQEATVTGYDEAIDLSGRDVTFEVTVNYIIRAVPPDYDDDFVKTYYSEWDLYTTEDLEEYLRNLISWNQILDEIWEDFVDECEVVSYDQDEVDSYETQIVEYYTEYFENLGYDFEEYIEYYYSMSLEDFTTQYITPQAESYTKESMIIYAIADEQDIEVTDDIYDREAQSYAASEGFDSVEELEEEYGEETVAYSILYNLVTQWVAEHCEIVDD